MVLFVYFECYKINGGSRRVGLNTAASSQTTSNFVSMVLKNYLQVQHSLLIYSVYFYML